jgi:hypothetical protein
MQIAGQESVATVNGSRRERILPRIEHGHGRMTIQQHNNDSSHDHEETCAEPPNNYRLNYNPGATNTIDCDVASHTTTGTTRSITTSRRSDNMLPLTLQSLVASHDAGAADRVAGQQ